MGSHEYTDYEHAEYYHSEYVHTGYHQTEYHQPTEYEHTEYVHTGYQQAEDHQATEYEHTDYEQTENQSTGYEHTECEPAEDEPVEDEPTEDESTDYEPTEDEEYTECGSGTEYEPTEDEHTEYYASEFRVGGAPLALIRNQVKGGQLKLVEIGARGGASVGVAGARVREKVSHAGASLKYGAYSVVHPFNPLRRRAARDVRQQRKLLATDRRRQRVDNIKGNFEAKIAKAREGRIAVLKEGVY